MDESTNKNRKDEPFVVINKKGLNIHPKLDRVFRFLQDVEQKTTGAVEVLQDSDCFRCQFVILFTHLETLRCVYTAYEEKTSNKENLKDASSEAFEKFINSFCLCEENQWVIDNSGRAARIGASDVRKLRNSLVHFFSVEKKISITPIYNEECKRIEKKTGYKTKFITPRDLYSIIHSAGRLMLKKWDMDCKQDLSDESNNFVERIECVRAVVNRDAPILVKMGNG